CLPLILYAQINSQQSQIRTGALMIAKRAFDDVRSTPFDQLPITPGATIESPVNLARPTPAEQIFTKALGRQYSTKVTFCATPSVCTATSRAYRVEVFFNDTATPIYGYQGIQTKFQ
ncbi:hypothetical protein, partial [Chamaesiphon sp.]|uniref:hypothetical protein n=1 Tax=Chamaesiphon sp. TaxID=2814140 RepID=UPI0035933B9C